MPMTPAEELEYLHQMLGNAMTLADLIDGDVKSQLRNIVTDRCNCLEEELKEEAKLES